MAWRGALGGPRLWGRGGWVGPVGEAAEPPCPMRFISPDALLRGTFLLRQGYGGQVLIKPGDFLCLAGEAHRAGRQGRTRLEIHAQKVEAA
jgi:hypothetical protein